MMKMIIDRFEGDIAVIETENGNIDIPKSDIPLNAKEGDILIKTSDGYDIAAEETSKRRKKLLEMMKRLTKE